MSISHALYTLCLEFLVLKSCTLYAKFLYHKRLMLWGLQFLNHVCDMLSVIVLNSRVLYSKQSKVCTYLLIQRVLTFFYYFKNIPCLKVMMDCRFSLLSRVVLEIIWFITVVEVSFRIKMKCLCISSHQTNSAHSGQHTGGAASCCIQTLFPEEKIQLVVVLLCAIWNFLNFYKHGL